MEKPASATQSLLEHPVDTVVKPSLSPQPLSGNASTVLRGVVIWAVIINHYFDHFTSVDRSNIANTMVIVFFVLSGYGISASLQKKLSIGRDTPSTYRIFINKIFAFYKIRVARIFPLLWISLLIQSLVVAQPYPLSAFLGYKLTGHYWFISSLLECYLLSPLLAWALSYHKHVALAVMTLLLLSTNHLIGINPDVKSVLMTAHLTSFPYLEIYLINIYLFFCGMYCQRLWQTRSLKLEQTQGQQPFNQYLIFWMLFAVSLSYTVIDRFLFGALPFFGNVLLFSATAIYALRIQFTPQDGFSQLMLFTGRHSLGLYLLHIPFYFLFARVGWIQMDSVLSLVLCLALLPLFIGTALKLENIAQIASKGLVSLRLRGANA